MRAVDTNILVRLATRDDARQVAAAEAFVASGAWVSHVVLVEFAWVLASNYERSGAEVVSAIGMFLEHDALTIQDADVVAAALENCRKRASVAFSDSLALELARKAGHLPLGTFDRALAKPPST